MLISTSITFKLSASTIYQHFETQSPSSSSKVVKTDHIFHTSNFFTQMTQTGNGQIATEFLQILSNQDISMLKMLKCWKVSLTDTPFFWSRPKWNWEVLAHSRFSSFIKLLFSFPREKTMFSHSQKACFRLERKTPTRFFI